MNAEKKNEPIVLLDGYDMSLGDKLVVKRMPTSTRWSLQAIVDGLAGGADATLAMKQSNAEPVEEAMLSDYYSGLSVTLDADGSKSMEDEMFTHAWMGIKLTVNSVTGGTLKLILKLADGNN